MPFDTKPSTFKSQCMGAPVALPELKVTEKKTRNGVRRLVDIVDVDQAHKPMPSFEQYDLANQLAAGIPLKQVNSVMFGSGSVDISTIPELSENVPEGEPEGENDNQGAND